MLAGPLTNSLKKNAFHWTSDTQMAFYTLKRAMTQVHVLALPDFVQEFIVETDACGVGIGAVLIQNSHPLAYYSQKLSEIMQLAFTYVRELYAITQAVQK